EALASTIPGDGAGRHQGIHVRVLAARGTAVLWSGRLDEAARILDAGVTAAAAPADERERVHCLGHLALTEALRGRLGPAAGRGGGPGRPGDSGGPGRRAAATRPAHRSRRARRPGLGARGAP